MTNLARFDRKVGAARERLRHAGSQAHERADAEPARDPLLAYDLALLASHGATAADPDIERAMAWRRRIGAAVLVLLISALAILAAFSGPEPSALSMPPSP